MAVTRTGSAVRRCILGRRLRRLREQAGLTLEVAAPRLDWSTSKLARIETAQQLVDVHGVRRTSRGSGRSAKAAGSSTSCVPWPCDRRSRWHSCGA